MVPGREDKARCRQRKKKGKMAADDARPREGSPFSKRAARFGGADRPELARRRSRCLSPASCRSPSFFFFCALFLSCVLFSFINQEGARNTQRLCIWASRLSLFFFSIRRTKTQMGRRKRGAPLGAARQKNPRARHESQTQISRGGGGIGTFSLTRHLVAFEKKGHTTIPSGVSFSPGGALQRRRLARDWAPTKKFGLVWAVGRRDRFDPLAP